jgi:hypothetical protein
MSKVKKFIPEGWTEEEVKQGFALLDRLAHKKNWDEQDSKDYYDLQDRLQATRLKNERVCKWNDEG